MTTDARKFWGKYRGTVINNIDTMGIARLLVTVPDVSGATPVMALPCLPYAGDRCGFVALPPVGAHVWIEYEKGDHNAPIWTGCFYERAHEVPDQVKPSPFGAAVLQLPGGAALILSDDPSRSIELRTLDGAKITFSAKGISITDGKGGTIELSAKAVDINNGALKVI